MSLRARLTAAIFLALLLSLAAGSGLSIWRAARSVTTELSAALDNARRGAAAALAAPEADPRRITAAFDGSRHIRARLLDASGAVLASSAPAGGAAPPAWLLALAAPALPDATLQAGDARLVLSAEPANEAEERWRDLQEQVGLLALFSAAAAALCAATATASLRPLTALSHGLARIGRGETDVRLARTGPPEIARLAGSVNAMAGAVRDARGQAARLQAQMATIAEEERTEIARDLHDEFGPLLFAISAFAAVIARLAESGDAPAIPAQARAIQEATADLQRQVRDLLGRLNDSGAEPSGLSESLARLIAFWRTVRPDVAFSLDAGPDECALPDPVRDALFRAAQEGVANAVRHARPRAVRIAASIGEGLASLTVADDGGGGPQGPGLGLTGMRARAAALGGRVDLQDMDGWTVTVSIPLRASAAMAGAA